MQTVNELLDAVKVRHGLRSDYKLALFVGITQTAVANYRHGRSRPDDRILVKLGQLAGRDVSALAASLSADRASTDEARTLWRGIAARLQAGAATVGAVVMSALVAILLIAGTPYSARADSLFSSKTGSGEKYTSYLVRLARLFRGWRHRCAAAILAGFGGSHALQTARAAFS